MAFPRKFKKLLELQRKDVPAPKQIWLTYSVCATRPDACGWQGWVLESAFNISELTCGPKNLLPGNYSDRCPNCGSQLFRTGASYRFDPSSQQDLPHGEPGIDYELVPIEYEDE